MSAASAQNLRMGTRYHIIDQEVQVITTHFADLAVTTKRTDDGRIATQLQTRPGHFIGEPIVSTPEKVRLVATSKLAKTRETIEFDLQPLDAVNADMYAAWKSNRLRSHKRFGDVEAALQKSEGPFIMPETAGAVTAVYTATKDLEVFSTRGERGVIDGKESPAFKSLLRRRGTEEVLGHLAWFEGARVAVFSTKWHPEPIGITADELGFDANMAWANIQLLSFAKSAQDTARARVASDGMETRTDNEPGCDYLHWLDGGILRPCCDTHDLCFEKEDPDCQAGTSWFFQGGWSCTKCNIDVVLCMTLRGWLNYLGYLPGGIIGIPIYRYDPPAPNCYIVIPGYCPPECFGCTFGDWTRPLI